MAKKSPVAIFMAATALLAASTIGTDYAVANEGKSPKGGFKEWNTDQNLDEESVLDDDAKKAREKAKESNVCIPIGEGENCW